MNYFARMTRLKSELKRRFVRLLRDEPFTETAPQRVTIEQLWDDLTQHYEEPFRWYHTLDHIEAMFIEFDTLAYRLDRRDLVSLGIFYHDVIYVPGAKDNEERSARHMAARIGPLDISADDLEIVKRLIVIGTKHPKSREVADALTNDERHISDLDLSGFSRSQDHVLEMSYNVRREFSIFDDEKFKRGQGEFLLSMLRQPIYLTDGMERHELKARENIKGVLGKLNEIVRVRPNDVRR